MQLFEVSDGQVRLLNCEEGNDGGRVRTKQHQPQRVGQYVHEPTLNCQWRSGLTCRKQDRDQSNSLSFAASVVKLLFQQVQTNLQEEFPKPHKNSRYQKCDNDASSMLRTHKYLVPPYKILWPGRPGAQHWYIRAFGYLPEVQKNSVLCL